MTFAKQFVFNALQIATLYREVSTSREAHGFATCCSIKRFGYRCTPVHHHWFTFFIGNCQTSDVEAFNLIWVFGIAIDSTKHQGGIAQIQCGETLQQLLIKSIAFVAGLKGAARACLIEFANMPGILAALVQAGISMVNIGLLGGKVRVLLAHFGVHQLYRQIPIANF